MGQTFASPFGVRSRILDRHPSHRFVLPSLGIGAISPVAQKIVIILWVVFGGIEECLELSIGYGSPIEIETRNMNAMTMRASRCVLPGILHIDTWIVSAFDFDAVYLKVVVALRDTKHARKGGLTRFRGWILHYGLWHRLPFARVTRERTPRTLSHIGQKILQHTIGH